MGDLAIGRFSEKGKQLQKILLTLVEDDDFVRLVADPNYNPSLLNLESGFNPYSLINTRLYTQVFKPPTDVEIVNVCVFYKKGGIGNGNVYYKNSDITFAIIVHRNLWNIEGGLRAFEIADRIDYLINNKNVTESLSKEWFKNFRYIPVDEFYGALELDYSNWD